MSKRELAKRAARTTEREKIQRQTQRSASGPVAKPTSSEAPVELPEGMWERIAKKAYELWELRGYREGYDLQDWFDAEAMVTEEMHEARE